MNLCMNKIRAYKTFLIHHEIPARFDKLLDKVQFAACLMQTTDCPSHYIIKSEKYGIYAQKKTAESAVALMVRLSDRSGEKPYCTFIICIRFHSVNTYFENVY
ncbi:hypothetical protein ASD40_22985 [Paenibacillus sp. Root444D2]|nr:hypothetical protein ASD40_22985 [Paenibacillus sp. Root444D2]